MAILAEAALLGRQFTTLVLNIGSHKRYLRESPGEVSEAVGSTFEELAKYHEKLAGLSFLRIFFEPLNYISLVVHPLVSSELDIGKAPFVS